MALHVPPVWPPLPTAASLQESMSESTHLAPRVEMEEDDYLDSDEFKDSVEQQIHSMNLHDALADCEKAIALFFNNRLDTAIAIMTPWKESSLYHAHAAAIFEFIPAVLTLEPAQIQRAQDALRRTFTLCARLRRSYTFVQSIGAIIKKPNYGGYTEEEAHAELVHAEALLLLACLGIIENEDMTGFLRASIRVKTSYNAYRMCAKILARKAWEDEASRAHFESGVRLGLATFNVMIAMMPPRIVTLLEFVGFSADKEKGKQELVKASQSPGLRSVLCDLTLLVYYLVLGHFAAIPPDFDAAEKIISKSLKKYPDSVWFLMFKARTQLLRGEVLSSIETYQKTCRMKDLWPQMKHLAYWELVWAFAMLRRWKTAAEYAAMLERDSKWSRTIYMYAQAAMLIENDPLSPDERECIKFLLMNATCYRQRLLGRSLPMEKFVQRRCDRWARRGHLVLPGVEWLYLWNIFPTLAATENNQADYILRIIEKTNATIKKALNKTQALEQHKTETQNNTIEYDTDDLALTEFLQGSLLAAMSLPRLALQNLQNVIEMKEVIQEHTFLIPYATVEIASCHFQLGDPYRAVDLLQEARKKYSGFLLEARLHFRIHSKLEYMRAEIDAKEKPVDAANLTGVDASVARKGQTSKLNYKTRLNTDINATGDSNIKPRPSPSINSGTDSCIRKPDPNSMNSKPGFHSTNPTPGPSSKTNILDDDSRLSSFTFADSLDPFLPPALIGSAICESVTCANDLEHTSCVQPGICSGKGDGSSTSFNMDLMTLSDPAPNSATAPDVTTATESSARRKGRT